MKGMTFLLAVAMILSISVVRAQPHARKTANRQYNQHKRIQHGVKSGQLTRREAGMLRAQQAKVRNYKRMAAADGRVTRNERIVINRAQRSANRNIYRQKHDGQVRRW